MKYIVFIIIITTFTAINLYGADSCYFSNLTYKTSSSMKRIPNEYLKHIAGLREAITFANPRQQYNQTDLIHNSLPKARLILTGRNLKSNVGFVLYSMISGVRMDYFQISNGKITCIESYYIYGKVYKMMDLIKLMRDRKYQLIGDELMY